MAKIDIERILSSNLPNVSGQRAFRAAQESTGLGSTTQGYFAAMKRPVPQNIPTTSLPQAPPAQQPPQAPPQALSFEDMLNQARPGGWPAVSNVFGEQMNSLWQQGNKDKYDAMFRRFIAEEQKASPAALV